jgi:hypothetical protein
VNDPITDIRLIEIPQRSSLLRTEVCYPFGWHGSASEHFRSASRPALSRVAMSLSSIVGRRPIRSAWLIGILFLVLSTNAPRALEFSRHNADSSGLNAIAATGRIEAGDSEKLLRYLRTLPGKPNTAIYLSSPGGSLIEGLKLGYLFKERRIKTIVEGDRPNNLCASACALAFLGGHDPQGRPWRSGTTSSLLGYHQFYCGDGQQCRDEQAAVSVILRFGRDVAAPLEIFIEMFNRPPQDMHWFSTSELCSLGIKVWDMSTKRFRC